MDKREYDPNSLINEALHEYPVMPLPSGFVNQVMTRVGSSPQAPVQERFQLQFIDMALPAFLGIITLAMYMMFLATTGRWEIAWLPATQLNGIIIEQITALTLTGLGILFALIISEVALGFFVCLNLWSDRPHFISDPSYPDKLPAVHHQRLGTQSNKIG